MSDAGRYIQSAAPERTAGLGRVGNTRTHLFFIDTQERAFTSIFTADGGLVVCGTGGRGW
jgi:hypothetical protein